MKKIKYIISLFVITSFLAQATFANTQMANQEISREYARLDYQLGSLWNQVDSTFKENATKVFSENLARIKKENGLTNDQVIEAVIKESKLDPIAASELKDFLEYTKANEVSDKEKSDFVANIVKNSQGTGASFNSDGASLLVLIIAIAAVVYLVIKLNEDPGKDEHEKKEIVNVCNDGNPNNNYGAGCSPCSDDNPSNDSSNFCNGYDWKCTSYNSWYNYYFISSYYEEARLGSLALCSSNTSYFDYCYISSCIKIAR